MREDIPLNWRFDYSYDRNPLFLERIRVNAIMNAGAIYHNDKYLLVARVEGNDCKSFFAFAESDNGVGRISKTVPGFAENACAYVHASMFSIAALFLTGASKDAWKQIEKSIIINHPNCDKTPFVMPNSYCRNSDYCIEESSQSDWFTGSGTVLYKNLFRFGFGFEPDLDGLNVQTAAVMPSEKASAKFIIKGKHITLNYENRGNGKREILINGNKATTVFDPIMKTEKLFIPTNELTNNMVIMVLD